MCVQSPTLNNIVQVEKGKKHEEEWNKKVDTEVGTLVDNMVELVGLASVNSCFARGASPISFVTS